MVTLGDANAWHISFMLGLCHFVDNLVVPSIDFLIASRRLRLIILQKKKRQQKLLALQFGVLSLLLLHLGRSVAHKLLIVAIMGSDRWFNDLIETALANHCTANLGGHAAAERASYARTCDLQ